jgi:hypothetical protein
VEWSSVGGRRAESREEQRSRGAEDEQIEYTKGTEGATQRVLISPNRTGESIGPVRGVVIFHPAL